MAPSRSGWRRANAALEAYPAHDGARKEANREHDPAPDGRSVDHRGAAVESAHDDARDVVRLTREGWNGKARGHARLHEAGADADDVNVTIGISEAEPLEESGEARLRG